LRREAGTSFFEKSLPEVPEMTTPGYKTIEAREKPSEGGNGEDSAEQTKGPGTVSKESEPGLLRNEFFFFVFKNDLHGYLVGIVFVPGFLAFQAEKFRWGAKPPPCGLGAPYAEGAGIVVEDSEGRLRRGGHGVILA
jgi:hypothetical protein